MTAPDPAAPALVNRLPLGAGISLIIAALALGLGRLARAPGQTQTMPIPGTWAARPEWDQGKTEELRFEGPAGASLSIQASAQTRGPRAVLVVRLIERAAEQARQSELTLERADPAVLLDACRSLQGTEGNTLELLRTSGARLLGQRLTAGGNEEFEVPPSTLLFEQFLLLIRQGVRGDAALQVAHELGGAPAVGLGRIAKSAERSLERPGEGAVPCEDWSLEVEGRIAARVTLEREGPRRLLAIELGARRYVLGSATWRPRGAAR